MLSLNKMLNQIKQNEKSFRQILLCAEHGRGAVKITMNGLQEVVEVRLGPEAKSLLQEGKLAEMLTECYNEALHTSRRLFKEEVSRVTGLANLPEIPGIF